MNAQFMNGQPQGGYDPSITSQDMFPYGVQGMAPGQHRTQVPPPGPNQSALNGMPPPQPRLPVRGGIAGPSPDIYNGMPVDSNVQHLKPGPGPVRGPSPTWTSPPFQPGVNVHNQPVMPPFGRPPNPNQLTGQMDSLSISESSALNTGGIPTLQQRLPPPVRGPQGVVPPSNVRPPVPGQQPPAGLPFPGPQGPYPQHGFQRPMTNPVSSNSNLPMPAVSQPPYSNPQTGFIPPPLGGNMPYAPSSVGSRPSVPGHLPQGPPPTHAVPPSMGPGMAYAQNQPGPAGSMQMTMGSPMESPIAPSMPYDGQNQNVPPGAYGQGGAPFMQGNQVPPGQPPVFPGKGLPPSATGPLQTQPQQPRRLDPDQMPSPIQVIEDDRKNRGGLFQTGQKGLVPPLVTTSFIAEDQGTCSPRFLRSTMYNIPCTGDLLKQSHLPFVVTLVPFARLHPKEAPPPIVDLGQMGPVRCNRCKAYMCPYMLFTDGGRKFQCSFCSCNTEVPPEYFAHLDHTGRRVDCYDRPELCLGAYEFVATADYCKNNSLPNPPAYIFMIDVSYMSMRNGLVNLLCTRLKEDILQHLPKESDEAESEVRVGFVTYGKELHFYNIKGSLAQPQMMVVSDVQDVFVPLLDGFLAKPSESEAIIDSLLIQISQMFAETQETEVVLGPVIQAGLDALKSSERPGKLIIFHSSLPKAEAPGKLKERDDRKLLGTDKEKSLLTPQTNFYTKLGQECVAAGCSVDIFLFPNGYVDVATVSEVSRLTGGAVYKYAYFQADLDGDILMSDLKTNISRPIAFDAVIRLRTSTGIRAVDFFGNFYMSNTTDVEMASVDCDKAISVEIKHDDKLSEAEGAYVQAAILYTSISGKRRLRVLNAAFNCCTQIADLFKNCELDMVINFMAKHAIRECVNSSSKQVRESLMDQCAHILACYRKNCASPSSAGQLILPEGMKLLPVYVNSVVKSGILASVDIATDDRSYVMHLVNAMSVNDSNVYFYPRLFPLHEMDLNSQSLPSPIRCSYERLRDNGVYLLENGLMMFIWIGLGVNPDWVRNVFGVSSAAQIDIDKTKLQDLDNPVSVRVRGIVKTVREERHRHMKLIIIRQRDRLEPVFQAYLVEDRGTGGSSSYVDFLCHIHKEIRSLLS